MTKISNPEKWKKIQFDFDSPAGTYYEISNLGRIRSYNKVTNGKILSPQITNGYYSINIRFFHERDARSQRKLDSLVQQKFKMARKIKDLKDSKANKTLIRQAENELANFKKEVSQQFLLDEKKRTVSFNKSIHRYVALNFLKRPSPKHIIVAHLDYDKLNNRVDNLKWMTQVENIEHQKGSPKVIEAKLASRGGRPGVITNSKLTVPKVMLLKKLLNEGKPMQKLVKQFKITHTQILRIKRGINWGDIDAAE